jgi:hypothetical protein
VIRILVMAQGQSTRMRSILGKGVPKHTIDIGGWSVLERTLWMLSGGGDNFDVTVIGPHKLREYLPQWHGAKQIELLQPGLCILQGIEQVREMWSKDDRTVILLGDVIYSIACLERLITATMPVTFAGTRYVNGACGELFGMSFGQDGVGIVTETLARRLCTDHGGTGQPGHLRLIMPELVRYDMSCEYAIIDDYTDDLDEPIDVEFVKAWRGGCAYLDILHSLGVMPPEVMMALDGVRAAGENAVRSLRQPLK